MEPIKPLVHQELMRLVRAGPAREHANHRHQTSELVSDAYVRLIDGSRVPWHERRTFAISDRVIRRSLVDMVRA